MAEPATSPEQAGGPLQLPRARLHTFHAPVSYYIPGLKAVEPLLCPSQPESSHSFWARAGTPSLLEPGILHTLRRKIFGFYTCLQTLGVWLQCRHEVTRLSSRASQGLWKPLSHRRCDLPSAESQAAPPGRSENLGHRFLPILLFTKNIDVCLVCLQPTFPVFFFLFLILSVLPLHPRDCVASWKKVPEGRPGPAPNSPRDTELVPSLSGASVSALVE